MNAWAQSMTGSVVSKTNLSVGFQDHSDFGMCATHDRAIKKTVAWASKQAL